MITKESIDKVYDAIVIEEVIGDFVQLKRSGGNYKGLSPFSNERTPSFMVSPSKQIWKDFSSGKGGNAIAFLMEHERFTYVEAIRYLAKKYNIELVETQISSEEKATAELKESLYTVSEYAKEHFKHNLLHTDEGKAIGLSYFKERGFTSESIATFELGYSLSGWSSFSDEALKNQYNLNYLTATGLTIVTNEGKKIDRFRSRVIFPIHAMSGRVLGFGGRILSTLDKKQAKYLNSPESDIYHKSKVLYGIFQAKQHIAKANNCYLVEGYTDVIQMHQKGIKNVVASSGTALTHEQIRLIHRLTPNITVLYDGDPAGLRASLRGIDLILEQGMNVRVCTFPDGDDPDSFSRKKTLQELEFYLKENTQDFIRFKASLLMQDSTHDPLKRAEVIRDMVQSIAKITEPIKQEIYIRECAGIMNISEQVLFATLAQISRKELQKHQKTPLPQIKNFQTPLTVVQHSSINPLQYTEKDLIKHLVLYGSKEFVFEEVLLHYNEKGEEQIVTQEKTLRVFEKFFLELQEDEIALSTPLFKELYELLMQQYQQNPQTDLKRWQYELSPELASIVANIQGDDELLQLHTWAEKKETYVKNKQDDVPYAVNAIILTLRKHFVTQKIKDLNQALLTTEDSEEYKQILQEVMDYISLQKLIAQRLNQVV